MRENRLVVKQDRFRMHVRRIHKDSPAVEEVSWKTVQFSSL